MLLYAYRIVQPKTILFQVCRLLLNKRNSPTLEHALAAITECIKLDTGCVRKVFTQTGTPVTALHQFFEEEDVFFAYGNERYASFVVNLLFIITFTIFNNFY